MDWVSTSRGLRFGLARLRAEDVRAEQFKVLTTCVRDAVLPPLTNAWRLDLADVSNGTRTAETVDDLGIVHMWQRRHSYAQCQ